VWKTGLPVRSAVLKPHAGELVVGWVTTSESSLLYVFVFASLSGTVGASDMGEGRGKNGVTILLTLLRRVREAEGRERASSYNYLQHIYREVNVWTNIHPPQILTLSSKLSQNRVMAAQKRFYRSPVEVKKEVCFEESLKI
jgi:hypothetical protein